MTSLRLLERLNREIESLSRHGCLRLSCVCVVLCIGSGHATRHITRPSSPTVCVKNDYGTEEEATDSVTTVRTVEKKEQKQYWWAVGFVSLMQNLDRANRQINILKATRQRNN
jgi:hypothetical protein